ncbi:MAG: hypothetical protein J6A46_05225 [Clostridia bacterium]|nr:hypothetical protein [Clostridia bacterium]
MDAKITKKRLGHMLSYDWVKILLSVVAAIMVWSIVFTVAATRITSTQRFVICNYRGVNYGNKMNLYSGYSYEIIEGEATDLLRGGGDRFYDLFMGNIEISEGDVMMVANYPATRQAKTDKDGNEIQDDQGNVVYEYGTTYMENALTSFYGNQCFARLDDNAETGEKGYFTQMNEYLGRFYSISSDGKQETFGEVTLTVKSFDSDSLNERAVKQAFRARVKKNKDKRFKKESEIVAGESKEIERIRAYLAAYETFFENLRSGKIALTTLSVEVPITETKSINVSGAYGINLCPNEKTMGKVKDQFYYTDFNGVTTAKDMNAMFLTLKELDKDFQYENLIYINALVSDVYVGA